MRARIKKFGDTTLEAFVRVTLRGEEGAGAFAENALLIGIAVIIGGIFLGQMTGIFNQVAEKMRALIGG